MLKPDVIGSTLWNCVKSNGLECCSQKSNDPMNFNVVAIIYSIYGCQLFRRLELLQRRFYDDVLSGEALCGSLIKTGRQLAC